MADLVAGKVHDRNSIVSAFGVAVAAADRYVRLLQRVPGVVSVREGRRLAVRFDFGEAVPRPSHPTAIAACWAAGLADVFVGSNYERGVRDALAYVTARARRSSEFKHADRKFLFVARGGESSLPDHAEQLDDLVEAVLRSRWAEIDYVHFGGARERKRIRPLSMAIHDHQLYVIGWDSTDPSPRAFRVSRIRAVEVLREEFEYPERALYDPQQVFHDSFGIFISDTYPVTHVRIRLDNAWSTYCHTHRWHVSQRIHDEPGGIVVSLTARLCPELKAWIRGFGSDAVVLEPPHLVAEMHETVRQMARNYGITELALRGRAGPKRASGGSRGVRHKSKVKHRS